MFTRMQWRKTPDLSCGESGLKGAKAFRVTKTVAGSERVLVVTYNPESGEDAVDDLAK